MNATLKNLTYLSLRPIELLHRIKNKAIQIVDKKAFSLELATKQAGVLFEKLGINRPDGINRLRQICGPSYPIDSEHQVLFASLAAKFPSGFKRILEIGTYDGDNARLLSMLFPKSLITTIDLTDEDPIFLSSYHRSDQAFLNKFLEKRKENLNISNNIIFKQMNSLCLMDSKETYDLIWVDGAHGYPVVAVDIVNSYRMLDGDGIMACDDVWIGRDEKESDPMYKSGATHEILKSFQSAGLINYNKIYKRLDFSSIGSRHAKEYIAIAARTN
jgi:predicted O-methyltransferase YrrM